MTAPARLVLFDVDGTLVDSQASIVAAMRAAFAALSVPAPERAAILAIVGLSLDHAIARLVPDAPRGRQAALVAAYKEAFHAARLTPEARAASPLYDGARAVLDDLAGRPGLVLGVATGKSRRGLEALIEMHGLAGFFATVQVADDHPSKPHPSMVLAAMAETGTAPARAVMIGDTSFDMQMAAAAGVPGIGVGWGYHPPEALRAHGARLIDSFAELPAALAALWEVPA